MTFAFVNGRCALLIDAHDAPDRLDRVMERKAKNLLLGDRGTLMQRVIAMDWR